MKPLDWKARRRGLIYCAPACGYDCTWAEYQECKRLAAALCKRLGQGWKPIIHENMGWFWRVQNGIITIHPYGHGRMITYSAWIETHGRQWIGKNCFIPERAVDHVVALVKRDLSEIQRVLEDLGR